MLAGSLRHALMPCAMLALLLVSGSGHAERLQMTAPLGGTLSIPTVSMKGSRFLATLRQQYDFSCGSAAVATLLTHHYDWAVDESAVFQVMFENGDQEKIRHDGFSMLDMKRYLDSRGFETSGVEANLDELARAGIPAIALINENGYAHFVVIKGIRGNDVLLGDPAMGTRVVARTDFERHWTNGILLVVTSHMATARFNHTDDWSIRPHAPASAHRDNIVRHSLSRPSMVDF